jgi:putative (di)nucleoside polyphosphate hydrolase
MIKSQDIFNDSLFRANVGIMLVNADHKIMAGEAFHYPGEWMMPQGGIDFAESPEEAMKRELVEETALEFEHTRLLREHNEWLGYKLGKPLEKNGKTYIGQRQKWFLLEYLGPLPDANKAQDREFIRFDWVDQDWLLAKTAGFKLGLYKEVFSVFDNYLP